MLFTQTLTEARLIRRYKRFLADVSLGSAQPVTVHCPNTGAMLGCDQPGSRVWLSRSDNPKRKYSRTWEMVEAAPDVLVGINTGRSNALVREAIDNGVIEALAGYPQVRAEVTIEGSRSRLDFLLSGADGRPDCFVEVKNVTAGGDNGTAIFPDAVSERASRHLRELMALGAQGARVVLCFCVQRSDVVRVAPADNIDPLYGKTLREAQAAGVELLAFGADLSPTGITLSRELEVWLP